MSSPALERLAIRRSSITTTTDVPAASPTVSRRVKEYEDAEKPQPFGRKTQITHVIIPAARLAEIPRKRSQVACLPRSRVGLQAEQAGTATSRSLGQILVSPLGSLLTGETARVSTWIQLAGHKGDFVTGHPGTICKKSSDMEKTAFEALMNDILKSFVPFYFREMTAESVSYLELQVSARIPPRSRDPSSDSIRSTLCSRIFWCILITLASWTSKWESGLFSSQKWERTRGEWTCSRR
eukprot:m.92957 g.92957  ORF g.92957 m.92957 type:complete len:239 (-) comp51188_c0_seq5:671-1387(-)